MDLNTQRNEQFKKQKNGMLHNILKAFMHEETKAQQADDGETTEQLLESIRNARNEWISANINFEYAKDTEMIDYYTFEIKACQVRYEYLIKKAKEKGIKVELVECSGDRLKMM